MDNTIVLDVKRLSKSYTDELGFKIHLLEDLNFQIEKSNITSVLAPSGSGKTSLLKIISGLEAASSGSVENVQNFKIVYIPSKPSSFPWLNVMENLVFMQKSEQKEEMREYIKIVGLAGYEDHFPENGSIGFRLRISLARALACGGDVIVLDEPFNKMDSLTKEELYLVVRKISEEEGITFILGTTNISEAVFLSDKIFLMKKNPGKIIHQLKVSRRGKRDLTFMDRDEFMDLRGSIENKFKSLDNHKLFNFTI